MKRTPGHPRTTGSSEKNPISFRVSADQHRELTLAGRKRKPKVSPHVEAKMRLFP